MRDHEIDEREDGRLWEVLLAPHVVRELELGVLGALRDDEPMARLRERVHEAPHEIDVGRAEAPEREVDESALTPSDPVGQVERGARLTNACVEAMPGGAERPRTGVVDLAGIEAQVQPLGLVQEVAARERWCTAIDEE